MFRTEHNFFRHPAAEEAGQLAFELQLGNAVLIIFGQEHRDAQRTSAWNNGYLVDRVMFRHQPADKGMPGLMKCREFLIFLGHHHGPALCAHHDFILGSFHVFHGHNLGIVAGRKQSSFVNQVGQVGTGKTGRATGGDSRFYIIIQRNLAQMHFEDRLAPANIR